MSARETIQKAASRALWEKNQTFSDAILSTLTSSGYRILGPDEIDAVTVEKFVSDMIYEWEKNREFLNVSPDIKKRFIKRKATAIRALCATHQGDK